jgi:hypothetical protein
MSKNIQGGKRKKKNLLKLILELLQLLNGKNKFSVNVISLFFSSDL